MGSDEIEGAVRDVVHGAVRRAGKAQALAAQLQDRLGRSYNYRTISAWARGDAMPPADALLAAAQAADISLDERLGIGREVSQLERELGELQAEVSRLGELTGQMWALLLDTRGKAGLPMPQREPAASASQPRGRQTGQERRKAGA
jgi:hypothetical protein